MRITIHRGSHEIGGACIELATSSTKILLDAGLPLSPDSTKIDIASLKPDAVVISHPHQDHYGLIDTIDPTTPIATTLFAVIMVRTMILNLVQGGTGAGYVLSAERVEGE